jgi:hypothetical protein
VTSSVVILSVKNDPIKLSVVKMRVVVPIVKNKPNMPSVENAARRRVVMLRVTN